MKLQKKYSILILAIVAIGIVLALLISTKLRNNNYIAESKAKEIALSHAKVIETAVTFVKVKLIHEDGIGVYDIEFHHDNIEYDYEIDAKTGTLLEYDQDIENYAIPQNEKGTSDFIGEVSAKEIALSNAKVTESSVIFIRVNLDHDDGIDHYDIEFYSNNIEYDYEINAKTGAVLEFDQDIENYTIPQNDDQQGKTNTSYISETTVKEKVLIHAGLSAESICNYYCKLDNDDGHKQYEVKFYVGNVEYEYEVDAFNGNILHWESDLD